MKKTRLLALLALFILTISSVSAAEFSSQDAYNWLASQSVDGSLEDDVTATAWSVLAFNGAGLSNKAQQSLDWIFSEQSADYCFPSPNCQTKDTALAVVAMNKLLREDNVTDIEDTLKNMMEGSSLGGMWAIEVSPLTTEISGECIISWYEGDNEEEKSFTVDNGKFPECGNSYFLDIDRCIKSGLLRNNPGITLTVDCLDVEGAKTISLIYKNDNNFYVLDSQETDKADLVVNNGCYGLAAGDMSCRPEPTLYVAWASELIGSDIDNSLYLAESYNEDSVMHNALLYMAKKAPLYLERLDELQEADGSFDRNVMDTALALIALNEDTVTYSEKIELAKEWLRTKQREDGSFGSVTETAAVLYAAFGNGAIDIDDTTEDIVECGDGYCDFLAGEDEDVCPDDCLFEDVEDESPETEVCVVNGICESDLGETYENCADDCYCGDGACDDVEDLEGSCADDCELGEVETVCGDGFCDAGEDEGNCPDDCAVEETEEGGSFFGTFIIILLILLVLGGGGYYAYKKGLFSKSKKPAGPFSKSGYNFRPRPPVTPSSMKNSKPMVKPKMPSPSKSSDKDDELSKSLEEARKLLKK